MPESRHTGPLVHIHDSAGAASVAVLLVVSPDILCGSALYLSLSYPPKHARNRYAHVVVAFLKHCDCLWEALVVGFIGFERGDKPLSSTLWLAFDCGNLFLSPEGYQRENAIEPTLYFAGWTFAKSSENDERGNSSGK